jgi:hypothetical protein
MLGIQHGGPDAPAVRCLADTCQLRAAAVLQQPFLCCVFCGLGGVGYVQHRHTPRAPMLQVLLAVLLSLVCMLMSSPGLGVVYGCFLPPLLYATTCTQFAAGVCV